MKKQRDVCEEERSLREVIRAIEEESRKEISTEVKAIYKKVKIDISEIISLVAQQNKQLA